MSRQSPLTAESVHALCDELSAAGTRPSIRQLQSRLTGSTVTISAHLRSWQGTRNASQATPEIPVELATALVQYANAIVTATTVELTAEKETLKSDLNVINEELQRKEDELRTVKDDRKILAGQLDTALADLKAARSLIERLEAQSATQQERLIEAEKRTAFAEGKLSALSKRDTQN